MVVFESEEMARRHSMQTRKTEKWLMFSMYSERRVARVRIGAIAKKVKAQWVVTALLKDAHK